MPTNEVTKLPVANKAAIEYLFKRACHTINAHSPLEMSDPIAVSRVLGELFQQMQADEKRWGTDLRTSKGWVCDLPAKLGGGAVSITSVNANSSRLQIQGNSKWNLAKPLDVSADQRAELEKIMLKFTQDGALLEVSSNNSNNGEQNVNNNPSPDATTKSRITLMGNSSSAAAKDSAGIRIFHVKETPQSRKHMSEILTFAQQMNMNQNSALQSAGLVPL